MHATNSTRPHAGRSRTKGLLALLALAVLITGCGGSNNNNALAPQFQPEVVNQTDTFQFQTTGITGVSQVLTYTWNNTGAQANVDKSCAMSGGAATLRVLDADGVEVYSGDLAVGGSAPTTAGAPGNWTVRVTLTNTTGTLNFRLQKRA